MNRHASWLLGAGRIALAAACGEVRPADDDDDASTTTTTNTSSTSGTGGGGEGGGPAVLPPCTTTPASTTPLLPEGGTLKLDAEIRCGEDDLGAAGVKLGLTEALTYVATSNGDHARLFDVRPAEARVVPLDLAAAPIGLAVADDGKLVVVGDATEPGAGYDGGLVALIGPPDALIRTPLHDNVDRYSPFVDVAVTPAGDVHAWYVSAFIETPPHNTYGETIIDLTGQVTRRDAPVPGETGWVRFGLTPDGRSVAFEVSPQPFQVRALLDGQTRALGSPTNDFSMDYQIASPPRPGAALVDYAVSILDTDGIRVAYPDGTTSAEVPLPGTQAWTSTCATGIVFPIPPQGCTDTCREQAVGVEGRAHAVAMLPGNAVAVAYVEKRADYQVSFVEAMFEGPVCQSVISDDQSTYELVVVEVGLGTGGLREHLRVPVDALIPNDVYSGTVAIDLLTHGNDVAVALRVKEAAGYKLRVLRAELDPN